MSDSKVIFLIAGQSNAVGYGNCGQSVDIGNIPAFEYEFRENTIKKLTDPVGSDELLFEKAKTGSAWPAFAKAFLEGSPQELLLISAARSGSSCHMKANLSPFDSWAPNGNLFENAIIKTSSALKVTGGCLAGIVWSQGERDANAINEGLLTGKEYEESLTLLIERFRDSLNATIPFYLIMTGYYKHHSKIGFDAVRKAQENISRAFSDVHIVFKDTHLLKPNDKLPDGIHYNQKTLNIIGKTVAAKIRELSLYQTNEKIGVY